MSELNGQNGNGNRVLWWIIGGVLTPLILSGIHTIAGTTERVARVEATLEAIVAKLERIEKQIDRILER